MKKRILKTGLSGIAATVIDVVAMILLIELGNVPVGFAAFLAASTGAIVNFAVSKFWAFRDTSPVDGRQVATFAMVALVTAGFVAVSVHVLAVMIGIQYLAAKAIAAVLIFACWSYPAQARLVFPMAPRVRVAR